MNLFNLRAVHWAAQSLLEIVPDPAVLSGLIYLFEEGLSLVSMWCHFPVRTHPTEEDLPLSLHFFNAESALIMKRVFRRAL